MKRNDFKKTNIDKSQTRVLAFLNILGRGMSNDRLDENNVADMDPAAATAKVRLFVAGGQQGHGAGIHTRQHARRPVVKRW